MADLIQMVEEAEKLQAEINIDLILLSLADLKKVKGFIRENFWTATKEQKEALERKSQCTNSN